MKSQKNKDLTPIIEGDYYVENGLYIFTKQYHLKRGYCCKNNCRHCPYGFQNKKENQHL
ncbi:DUF5522 domain-containing protein [Reichenbachiella sp. MALMAid0571]|uniref:DUF5522 domain-containing protein n=1 Tax=Reichenbachiella sp. MALMAid0571 TaxID=3143939 RepID=UPI0032DE38B2